MTIILDFQECLTDSPRTRAAMETVEYEVFDLESRLEKLVKLCAHTMDGGRQYCSANRQFVCALRDLSFHSQEDSMLEECLGKFSEGLNRLIDHHTELLDSIQQSFKQKLQHLLKEDLRSFKESRKELERCREGLESALNHNSEMSRKKAQEIQEASSAVQMSRRVFRERVLDYTLQINVIQGKKKFDILEFMLQLIDAQAGFLAQSHAVLHNLDDYRKGLAAQVHQKVLEGARETRDLEQKLISMKHKDISDEDAVHQGDGETSEVVIEGYLFKRASNTFKTWSRRWFSIQNNQLVYQKKVNVLTVVIVDLRLCAVKLCPDADRRLCFEVVSPSKSLGVHFSKVRSLTLDSWEPELVKLMCELGNATINGIYEARIEEMSIKKPTSSSIRSEKEIWIRAKYVEKKFITKLPQTMLRTSQDKPAGRPLSTPESRALESKSTAGVKKWPINSPGRQRDNSFLDITARKDNTGAGPEGKRPITRLKPKPQIRPKPGTAPPPPAGTKSRMGDGHDLANLHPGALLYRAAEHRYLPTMADALAHGADVNWVHSEEDGRTPLIQAVLSDSLVACEFLLQNGASVNQADRDGRGALHHATLQGFTGLACLFLKRGADINALDTDRKDVLSIAIEAANADIVTLLRLVKMREADIALGQSGDETYQDIFRDFSLMASDAPEKLTRRSCDLRLSTL
ncbi:arf-GAP with coiled-coil, ANK repeat and PH domain-containing protein 1 isoform 2-T2 [Anomaloglossus baeobatrachus]|uniref:arf-GAP with coiled-coil, ANK repeat and PH domain-containing protein 1 isoform X2 n=1 Tax=Anomaloglossus baeobatrachus TaxID=238106 RepID=UPI003F4FA822